MRLRGLLFENWGLKLLSLAFAVILWLFVVGEKRSEVSLSVPLELTRVPSDMVIVSPVPEAIRVRLNGPRPLIAAVNPDNLAVTLDLEGVQPGISAFEILPSRLDLPRGIDVTYISPSVVTLEADRKVQVVLPVKPRLRGTPAEGFEVAGVRVDPDRVEVEGAERILRQLKEVPTEVVDVSGLEGGVARPVTLVMPDPAVKPVDKAPVRLAVEVREVHAEREFLRVPVAVPAPGWRATPPAVDVKVAGSLRTLTPLTGRDVTAAVDPFVQPPPGPVPVRVGVPSAVEVVEVRPEAVALEPVEPAGDGGPPATPSQQPGG